MNYALSATHETIALSLVSRSPKSEGGVAAFEEGVPRKGALEAVQV